MTVKFVDTNVLLYAISKNPQEATKANRAQEILADPQLALSTQVLQEFYVQATRKSRPDAIPHQIAADLVTTFTRFTVQPITIEIVFAALATKSRFQLSYWDSAIIEAARAIGCETVISEDLADGQDYDGIMVLNPFSDLT